MDGSLDRVPDRVVAAIAAHGLPSRARLPARELDDAAFDQVLDAVRRHRVLGMLAAAVADGAFPVTDTQRERCAALEEEWAVLALELERLLLGVASVLERAGIVYRVFKGPALAHTVYPHAAWRMFADLDLVVPGGATFDAARDAIITGLGAVQSIPELRPGFDAEFGKTAMQPTLSHLVPQPDADSCPEPEPPSGWKSKTTGSGPVSLAAGGM